MSNRLIPDERIRDDIAACADLLKLEFAGNDPTQLYQLAFSRLTKPNLFRQLGGNRHAALRAPFLKGTDQRDQFVPHLARVLATQDMMSVLDIGCGEGTSTGFLLEACPGLADRITHITYSDVSDPYLDSYEEAVVSRYAIASSDRLKMPFDRLDSVAAGCQHTVCLILHSLYFLSDPGTLRAKLAGWLAPGALVLIVVADERACFTGAMVDSYLKASSGGGKSLQDPVADYVKSLENHATAQSTGLTLLSLEQQPTRIYADDFGDLIAAAFVTTLIGLEGEMGDKIDHVADALTEQADSIDLTLETRGLRRGCLSVAQPQLVAVCEFSG